MRSDIGRASGLAALLLLSACAASGPRASVDAYRQAVAEGDWTRVHALSDRATRAAFSPEELARIADAEPDNVRAALRRLAAGASGAWRAEGLGAEGGLAVVEEPGGWRVAEGGLALPWDVTPDRALRTFFRALDAERWDLVRRVIPRPRAHDFDSDAALRAHLEAMAPRIAAARAAIGKDLAGRFVVSGTEARLGYGQGRAVRMVSEDGRWRVWDLE